MLKHLGNLLTALLTGVALLSASVSAPAGEPSKMAQAAAPSKKAPVTIMAFGNRLIIQSDDKDALDLIAALSRLMAHTPPAEADFEIFKLKYIDAVETAKLLGTVFKGRQDVRVIADPATNTLLVQARPPDMQAIRSFLSQSLDTHVNEADVATKSYLLGPLQYTRCADVAAIIHDVYQESMNGSARVGIGFNSPFGLALAPGHGQENKGVTHVITLTVSADERTNSIIVGCPPPVYADIKKLVEQLEVAASETKMMVKIVRIKGIDPSVVQEALETIQSVYKRRPGTDSTSRDSFSGGSSTGSRLSRFLDGTGLEPR